MSITENRLKSTHVYGEFRQIGYTGTTGGVYIENDLNVSGNIIYKGETLGTGSNATIEPNIYRYSGNSTLRLFPIIKSP